MNTKPSRHFLGINEGRDEFDDAEKNKWSL